MNPARQRRVAVTGIGVIAPNGCGPEAFWASIREGRSAVRRLARFAPDPFPSQNAAEVTDFEAAWLPEPRKAKRYERSVQFALAAALRAWRDAGFEGAPREPGRAGLIEGTSVSGLESSFEGQRAYGEGGYRQVSPLTMINGYPGGAGGEIARCLGLRGQAVALCTGSASGSDAIGEGFRMIRDGGLDLVVAGGSEAPLLEPVWGAFCRAGVMSRRGGPPGEAMRPFDRDRDGFVLGEGAAFLVLEEWGAARWRGARIYAEIAGHARHCEAHHPVGIHPEGRGIREVIAETLRQARVCPAEVDYANLHGSATAENDAIEARAVSDVFLARSQPIMAGSTKPVTGHLLGAAGAVEAAVCVLALHRGECPPSINLHRPPPDCRIDFVPGLARPYPIRHALNLNSGFGGKNSCLLFKAAA